jgi:hypothetical protein
VWSMGTVHEDNKLRKKKKKRLWAFEKLLPPNFQLKKKKKALKICYSNFFRQ